MNWIEPSLIAVLNSHRPYNKNAFLMLYRVETLFAKQLLVWERLLFSSCLFYISLMRIAIPPQLWLCVTPKNWHIRSRKNLIDFQGIYQKLEMRYFMVELQWRTILRFLRVQILPILSSEHPVESWPLCRTSTSASKSSKCSSLMSATKCSMKLTWEPRFKKSSWV